MRAFIIINPRSGLKKTHETPGGSRRERALRWLSEAGLDAEVRVTERSGHAFELAASAVSSGFDRVVAWGGDGTVNETAGALFGTTTALGIIPGGSGDGLARSLNLPRDPEAAFRLAMTAHPRPIDVGWLAGRHFVNIAGVGFDAEVARRFNTRTARGTRGYLSVGLGLVWSYACESYDIRGEGLEFSGPHFLVAFANGREYGSGLVLAPDASLSDGWFDSVIVTGGSAIQQLWRSRRLGFRRTSPAEGVWRGRVRNASIAGARLVCHVDGEPFEARGRVDVRLDPGALLMVGA